MSRCQHLQREVIILLQRVKVGKSEVRWYTIYGHVTIAETFVCGPTSAPSNIQSLFDF